MSTMNDHLEELSVAIDNFCQDCLDDEAGDASAESLCVTVKQFLPGLFMEIPEAPNIILAKRLIKYALEGLDNHILSELWRLYYLKQEPPKTVAQSVGYSTKTIQRQILVFPKKVAVQLWEKNYEIANPLADQQPMTENQKKKKFIQERFGLTPIQSNVLLEFWLRENTGRDQICSDLYMAHSTLKSHIRKILHKVGARDMNNAVIKTEIAYRQNPISRKINTKYTLALGSLLSNIAKNNNDENNRSMDLEASHVPDQD